MIMSPYPLGIANWTVSDVYKTNIKKKEETGIKHAMFLQIDNYFKAGNRAECSLF